MSELHSFSRHTDENRYPDQSHYWIPAFAGMTNRAEAG